MLFEHNERLYGYSYEGGPLCEYDETGSPVRIAYGEEAEEVAEAMESFLHDFDPFEDIGGGNGPLIAE